MSEAMKAVASAIIFLAWTVMSLDVGHKSIADYPAAVQAVMAFGWLFWLVVTMFFIIRT